MGQWAVDNPRFVSPTTVDVCHHRRIDQLRVDLLLLLLLLVVVVLVPSGEVSFVQKVGSVRQKASASLI